MANVCQMEEVVLLVCACLVLAVLDVNQDLHVLLILVKMVEYVYSQDLATDAIVLLVLLAIIVKQKICVLAIHVKMEDNVDHKVQPSRVNALMDFQARDASHRTHVSQTRK